jgi:hypothetical protein
MLIRQLRSFVCQGGGGGGEVEVKIRLCEGSAGGELAESWRTVKFKCASIAFLSP